MSSAIVLLSGGLDSFVALDISIKKFNSVSTIFFDYGQKAYEEEKKAVENIIKKYSLKNHEIKLPF